MIHVKTDEIYGKNPIANVSDYRTHLVSIDSRFRHNLLEPSTDFQYRFAHPYKNVIKARVASVEIPPAYYNFSKAKKNTMFRLDVLDYIGQRHFLTVAGDEGYYPTVEALVKAIQEKLHAFRDQYGVFFRLEYNPLTHRVTLFHDGSAPPPCPVAPTHCPVAFGVTWMMVGQEDRRADYGLGALLGFVKPFYTVDSPFQVTSESLATVCPDRYLLLAVDDLYAVEHRTDDSYVSCLAKVDLGGGCGSGGAAVGAAVGAAYGLLDAASVTFTRPRDMTQCRIRLLDAHGAVVDTHDAHWSLSLELTEVMSMPLYDDYRLTVWSEEEPRAVRQTSGAAAAIAPPALNYH